MGNNQGQDFMIFNNNILDQFIQSEEKTKLMMIMVSQVQEPIKGIKILWNIIIHLLISVVAQTDRERTHQAKITFQDQDSMKMTLIIMLEIALLLLIQSLKQNINNKLVKHLGQDIINFQQK